MAKIKERIEEKRKTFVSLFGVGSSSLAVESGVLVGNSSNVTSSTSTTIQNLGNAIIPAQNNLLVQPSTGMPLTPTEPINVCVQGVHSIANGTSVASVHVTANSLECTIQDYSGMGGGLNKVVAVSSAHATNITSPSGMNLQFVLQNGQNNTWILHVNQVFQNTLNKYIFEPHAFLQTLHTLTPFIEASLIITAIGGVGLVLGHVLRSEKKNR